MEDGSQLNTYTYDINGIYSANMGTSRYVYAKDPHGSIVGVVNSSGAYIAQGEYTAFGERFDTNTFVTLFGYCGEYTDSESGLVYLRNRYYDPSTGRFITEDKHWNADNCIYSEDEYIDEGKKQPNGNSIKQSIDLYIYCINNPVNYYDFSGLDAGDWFDSEEAAAKDFGMIYNIKSIKENVEYGAYIYSFEGIKNINNKAVIKTFYSYAKPVSGDENSISTEKFTKVDETNSITAIIHTHGRYNNKKYVEIFSNADYSAQKDQGLERSYLVTPGGFLKLCYTENAHVIILSKGMPYDAQSPDKAWYRGKAGIVKY